MTKKAELTLENVVPRRRSPPPPPPQPPPDSIHDDEQQCRGEGGGDEQAPHVPTELPEDCVVLGERPRLRGADHQGVAEHEGGQVVDVLVSVRQDALLADAEVVQGGAHLENKAIMIILDMLDYKFRR